MNEWINDSIKSMHLTISTSLNFQNQPVKLKYLQSNVWHKGSPNENHDFAPYRISFPPQDEITPTTLL